MNLLERVRHDAELAVAGECDGYLLSAGAYDQVQLDLVAVAEAAQELMAELSLIGGGRRVETAHQKLAEALAPLGEPSQ